MSNESTTPITSPTAAPIPTTPVKPQESSTPGSATPPALPAAHTTIGDPVRREFGDMSDAPKNVAAAPVPPAIARA